MLASSGRRSWVHRTLALGVASLVCAASSNSGAADTGILFPATNAYHRRNYDPFDEAAPQAVDEAPACTAPSTIAAISDDDVAHDYLAHDDVVHSDFHAPILQPPADDPFDRLPLVESSVTSCAFQAVGTEAQPATEPEALPAPQPKYEHEQSEEPAGSTWSAKPVSELTTDIMLPGGLLPKNHWTSRPQQFVACGDMCGTIRGWPVKTFAWVASCLCHNPLYFEEINLERYGYGCGCYGPCCSNCLQSAVSACHFFGTIPALPWEMAVDCPCECDYSLGYYRPGSCPPWRYNCCTQPRCLGALSEGGVATALVFLIP